jgi:hypothetical protein
MNLKSYSEAKGKTDKSKILNDIVESIRESSPTDGFVKKDFITVNGWQSMIKMLEPRSDVHCVTPLLEWLDTHSLIPNT